MKKVRECVWEEPVEGEMNVPVRIYASDNLISHLKSDNTLNQAKNVAALPGIVDASIVMPDAHEGYGFSIGGVAAFSDEGVISPGGIGFDINCGIRLLRTGLNYDEVLPHISELVDSIFNLVPSGLGRGSKLKLTRNEMYDAITGGAKWAVEQGYGYASDVKHIEENGNMEGANADAVSSKAFKRGRQQLGTLGAGNHFLEIQKVGSVFDPHVASKFGLKQDEVTVMIHTGSRGFGHQVCSDHLKIMLDASRKYGIELPDWQLAAAPVKSPEAQSYLGAMRAAVNFAFANRQIITHWVREAFSKFFDARLDVVYEVAHNIAKNETHTVDGVKQKLWVHRKGATRAFAAGRPEIPSDYNDVGQPVVVAGSMGTASYVLVGTELGMRETFGSSCHGAGRAMSRSKAKKTYTPGVVSSELQSHGIYAHAASQRVLVEEAPGAYKDVDEVIKSMECAGVSKPVVRLVPLGVVKG